MAANRDFSSFIPIWFTGQEDLLRQMDRLLSPVDGFDRRRECTEMIPRVLRHYRDFQREKACAAADDVFVLISPPWMSSFERSMLWASWFRPSVLFRIVEASVASGELSEEQRRRIDAAKVRTRWWEREISGAMARVQEMVAEQPVYGLLREFGKKASKDEEQEEEESRAGEVAAVMGGLKAGLTAVVECADALREWTAAEVTAALEPFQAVKFLSAFVRFQVEARKWGAAKDRVRKDKNWNRG